MPIEINKLIRSRRKTIALIVKPDGSLVVRAPLRASNRSIHEFIAKNSLWIERKQTQARAAVPPTPRRYISGEEFLYLGSAYPLEIVTDQEQSLLLNGNFKLAESALVDAQAVFEGWYREHARRILVERVDCFARQHSFQYKRIGVTSARTRWGSCSAAASLSFSWRLILAPMQVVDYVVVHELVHTVFHDHSGQFWGRVEQICPDYREHRGWLKKNGQQLLD